MFRPSIAAIALVSPLLLVVPAPASGSAPSPSGQSAHQVDNRPGPLTARQEARRKAAQELILTGETQVGRDGVVQLGEDKYFQAALTGTDRIFTTLAEFGDSGSPRFGDEPGPLHNQIPEPAENDNTTIWVQDFSRAHYEDLFFGAGPSFADYYLQQSSGIYTVNGSVADWVQVPGNASTYGDNAVEGVGGAWQFVEDSANAWYAAQIGAGRTPEQIRAELATFDVWDRYDFDHDGDFDEPDGYLDHFQAVHAGVGEETGGGAQGEDAIWSHRWYVNGDDFGVTGPTVDGVAVKFGGAQIGDSEFWIGDYTTEPENGGLGVFTHEFAHDLGLPDFYNYVGERYNGVGFWSLMSLGSYSNRPGEGIGETPTNLGPWEKLQLGWLDYVVTSPGQGGSFTLSPSGIQVTGQEQALVVDVPDDPTTQTFATPYSGSYAWWTGSGDDLTSTLTRTVDLTGFSRATLTARAWYDTEAGYDFLYAEYSTDGGATWERAGSPISGSSRGRWATLRFPVPAGGPLTFRFRYSTDAYVRLPGAFIDDIKVAAGRTVVFADDVERGTNGWAAAGGFERSTGTESLGGDRYYLAENRTYVGYDDTLASGPFYFSAGYSAYDYAERFAYEDGLLVWAIDETYSDNEVYDHPGHGLALPLDARPAPLYWPDGFVVTNHVQVFDATFGVQATDPLTLHREVLVGRGPNATVETLTLHVPSRAGISTFDDTVPDAYWSADNPTSSALVAGHGATMTVTSQTTGGAISVTVHNPPGP